MTNEEKMTPEEAIAEISFLKVAVNKVMEQALDMAIQALSQEPCEAISRDALITKLVGLIKTERSTIEIKAKLIPMIEQLPSVTQKSGKWIITPFSVTGRHYQCSECRYIHTFAAFEYCPNCGAKMESEDK